MSFRGATSLFSKNEDDIEIVSERKVLSQSTMKYQERANQQKNMVRKGHGGKSSGQKQRAISSFFASSRKTTSTTNITSSNRNNGPSLTTPEKVNLTRSDSILSKAFTSSRGDFEEIGSSDTSFDTSLEVMNFRNPNLSNTIKKQTKYASQPSQSDSQSTASLKRSASDLLGSFSMGQARKVPKLERYSVEPVENDGDSTLSDEQHKVINTVMVDKKNVFYTGSAGTGKSVVLRALVTRLKRVYQDKVGITASTGMAACNIQGQTLHKFLGIGLGQGTSKEIANRITKSYMNVRKWQALKVLVIDEISMIDGELFDKLNEVAQIVRKNNRPFGGVQLVCTGDFFQLPPVSKQGTAKYCFQSVSWNKVIEKTILLTKVFRQQGDNELIEMLNSLRYGALDHEISRKFYALERPVKYQDGIEPTELFPTRIEVKNANTARLNQLKSSPIIFKSKDNVVAPELRKQLENLICEEVLVLKEGAQVMYLKNYSDSLVNGSIGTIVFFLTQRLWQKVLEFYGYPDASDPQMLDEMRLLSSRMGVKEPWDEKEALRFEKIPSERKSIFMKLCALAGDEPLSDRLPVVNFRLDGSDELFLVEKHEFSIDYGKKFTKPGTDPIPEKLVREQLPLLLSWAISIHKAQGQTIDRLRIDLGKSFEKGQVYVALSRAKNKEHLEIKNFHPSKVVAADVVKKYYQDINTAEYSIRSGTF